MTYQTRVLHRDEYPKLGELPEESGLLPTLWPLLRDGVTQVVVVEAVEDDGTRRIVGVGVIAAVLHGEQLWVAPEARGSGGALSPLLAALSAVVRDCGATSVMSHVTDPEIERRLEAHGATRLNGSVWRVPVLPAGERA